MARVPAFAAAGPALTVLVLLAAGCDAGGSPLGRDETPSLPVEATFDDECWTTADDEHATAGCKDGEYRIYVKQANELQIVSLPVERTRAVSVEADVRVHEWAAKDADSSLMRGVGCLTGERGYGFVVANDGYWAILRENESGRSEIVREASEPLDGDGLAMRRVRGECAVRGGLVALAISVDGRRLSVAHAARVARGGFDGVGVYAATSEPGTDIRFDNVRVGALDGSALARLEQDTGAADSGPLHRVDADALVVALEEDFSIPGDGWPSRRAFERGAYALGAAGEGHAVALHRMPASSAVVVEATAVRATRAPDESFGLACHTGRGEAGYLFSVSSSGGYAIFAERAGQSPGEPFDVVDDGVREDVRRVIEPVVLRAECAADADGTHLALFVNGERWTTAVDRAGLALFGSAGFFVSAQRTRAKVYFDDARVSVLGEVDDVRDPAPPDAPDTGGGMETASAPSPLLFRGSESWWTIDDEDGKISARRGVYRLEVRGQGGAYPEELAREVGQVEVTATVTDLTRGKRGGGLHGIACSRENEPRGSYVFSIDAATGGFRVERWYVSAVERLVDGRRRDVVRPPGSPNRLRVECRAGLRATRIVLEVNGRVLFRHADERIVRIERFDSLDLYTHPHTTASLRMANVRARELGRRGRG